MIYVCIPSYNEAGTVGLLLWKIRQVFSGFPREYQLLVVDDASTDATNEILNPYAKVLPLSVVRHAVRQGYARSVERLLRLALERTDRPRRDCAVLMHADFAHSAEALPELVKLIERGADLVVAEGSVRGHSSSVEPWLRRFAGALLRTRVRVPGVSDLISGFVAFRLSVLKGAFQGPATTVLTTDGWSANAELIGHAATHARRIETIRVVERHDLRQRASRFDPWQTLKDVCQARRRLRPMRVQGTQRAPSTIQQTTEAAR